MTQLNGVDPPTVNAGDSKPRSPTAFLDYEA